LYAKRDPASAGEPPGNKFPNFALFSWSSGRPAAGSGTKPNGFSRTRTAKKKTKGSEVFHFITGYFQDAQAGYGQYHARYSPQKVSRHQRCNGKEGVQIDLAPHHQRGNDIELDELYNGIGQQHTDHHFGTPTL